jgi:hypothetical protein
MAVADIPDADGDIPEMIDEVWDYEGSWLGRGVEVARSPTHVTLQTVRRYVLTVAPRACQVTYGLPIFG